jgi:putative transposase
MKRLAGRQTRYVSKQEHRTGSLREGCYKMSIVESDSYFLQCCRYIELNPVKAKMVAQPEHYRWSSYQENAGLPPPQIINRTAFKNLNDISVDHYREFIAQGSSTSEAMFISQMLESNCLTGGAPFVEEIERRTEIRLEFKRPGQPAKEQKSKRAKDH